VIVAGGAGVKHYTQICRSGDEWLAIIYAWDARVGMFRAQRYEIGDREYIRKAVRAALLVTPAGYDASDPVQPEEVETNCPSGVFALKPASESQELPVQRRKK
jgi:hypothetical protein